MPTESTEFIAGLDQSKPQGSESLSEADDHLRLLKKSITATFAGSAGDYYDKPVNVGPDQLNSIPNTVKLTGDQTINGNKQFVEPVQANAGVVDSAGRNLIDDSAGYCLVGTYATTPALLGGNKDDFVCAYNDGNTLAKILNVNNIADLLYPVDSYIIGGPDPGLRFSGTVWDEIQGRVLVGAGMGTDGNGKSMTFPDKTEGGFYEHTLTEDEMPIHTHLEEQVSNVEVGTGTGKNIQANALNNQCGPAGGDQPHANVQPWVAATMWRRAS